MTYFGLPTDPPAFDRAELFGPWHVGFAVDGVLLGAILCLTIEYYRFCSNDDGKRVKWMVAIAAVATVLKSMELYANLWYKLVAGWGNYEMAYTYIPWYVTLEPLWNVLIVLLSQTFFLIRLYSFLRELKWAIYFIIFIVALMLLEFAAHIVISVQVFNMVSFVEMAILAKADTAGTVGMMATDIIITASLCYALLYSKTGISKTDSLITKLVMLSFTTALIPSACNIVRVALYRTYYFNSSAWMVFAIMQPKLYTLAMLITLNLRQALRSGGSLATGPTGSYEMSRSNAVFASGRGRAAVGINVYKESHTMHDEYNKEATLTSDDVHANFGRDKTHPVV